MKILPLSNRVLVKKIDRNEKTAGGIYIPQTAADQEQAWRGEVRAVGPGKRLDNGKTDEPSVKVGDVVIVGRYSGATITIDNEELRVVTGDDILGVVEAG